MMPMSDAVSDRIRLRGIRFHGRHGVFDVEREVGQWYRVDVDLLVDLRVAGRTDDLGESVDYGDVCRRIVVLGSERSYRLGEALAEAIADMVLGSFAVSGVRVLVEKTPPPALVDMLAPWGSVESSAVEIVRSREE